MTEPISETSLPIEQILTNPELTPETPAFQPFSPETTGSIQNISQQPVGQGREHLVRTATLSTNNDETKQVVIKIPHGREAYDIPYEHLRIIWEKLDVMGYGHLLAEPLGTITTKNGETALVQVQVLGPQLGTTLYEAALEYVKHENDDPPPANPLKVDDHLRQSFLDLVCALPTAAEAAGNQYWCVSLVEDDIHISQPPPNNTFANTHLVAIDPSLRPTSEYLDPKTFHLFTPDVIPLRNITELIWQGTIFHSTKDSSNDPYSDPNFAYQAQKRLQKMFNPINLSDHAPTKETFQKEFDKFCQDFPLQDSRIKKFIFELYYSYFYHFGHLYKIGPYLMKETPIFSPETTFQEILSFWETCRDQE